MSEILRATSNGYGKQIKSIETQIAAQKKSIEALEKRKADLIDAKKTIDDQLPPLPEKPAVPKAARSPRPGTASTGG